jgi:hypothetical protein
MNYADLVCDDAENATIVSEAKLLFTSIRKIKHPNGFCQLFVADNKKEIMKGIQNTQFDRPLYMEKTATPYIVVKRWLNGNEAWEATLYDGKGGGRGVYASSATGAEFKLRTTYFCEGIESTIDNSTLRERLGESSLRTRF